MFTGRPLCFKMHKILIIESATRYPSIGITENGLIKSFYSGKEGNHSVFFFETLKNFDKNKIGKIIITIGPGRFTSLRVGLSFALGFAIPRRIKIIPVNTFDVLENELRKKFNNFGIFLKKGGEGFLFREYNKGGKSVMRILKELPRGIKLFTFEPLNFRFDYEIKILSPSMILNYYRENQENIKERDDYENIKPLYSFLPYEKSLIEKGKIKGYY